MSSHSKTRGDYQALTPEESFLPDDKGVVNRIAREKGQQQWHVIRLLLAEGVLFLLLFAAYMFSVTTTSLGHNQRDECKYPQTLSSAAHIILTRISWYRFQAWNLQCDKNFHRGFRLDGTEREGRPVLG